MGIAIYQSKALFKGFYRPLSNFSLIEETLLIQQKKIVWMILDAADFFFFLVIPGCRNSVIPYYIKMSPDKEYAKANMFSAYKIFETIWHWIVFCKLWSGPLIKIKILWWATSALEKSFRLI